MSGRLASASELVTGYADRLSRGQRYGLAGAALVVLAAVPLVTENFFLMNVLIVTFLFVTLGHGWNVVGGYAGQISLGHAVMFAAGAYTVAILWAYYGVTPLVGIPAAGVVAAVVGVGLGMATFSLRYHYFAMATLAAALIGKVVFFRWEWVGGATGIEYPLDPVCRSLACEGGNLLSLSFGGKVPYYYMAGTLALLVTLFMYRLDSSKLGVYLKAINMDQELAENAGLSAFWYKIYAMAISSFITGLGGALYAQYVLYIDPLSTLRVLRNIDIIMVPIIGGVGTVLGPIIGAFVFIPVREFTRTTLSGTSTGLGWVVFGVVLLLISVYRPGGLLNEYSGRGNQ